MQALYDTVRTYIDEHQTLVFAVAGVSAALLVISLITLPLVAVWMPADFAVRHAQGPRKKPTPHPHPVVYWSARALKNLLGGFLLLAGLAMLVLPGQGLLTIALAVVLLDVPGKRRFEARLLRSPWLHTPINRLRKRFGRPPLLR
jgi:hypothetical protein